jgi:hypothetical protein
VAVIALLSWTPAILSNVNQLPKMESSNAKRQTFKDGIQFWFFCQITRKYRIQPVCIALASLSRVMF